MLLIGLLIAFITKFKIYRFLIQECEDTFVGKNIKVNFICCNFYHLYIPVSRTDESQSPV